MSCPTGNTKTACAENGSTPCPPVTIQPLVEYGGRQWRPIQGDPQPARVYLLRGRDGDLVGVTDVKMERVTGKRSLVTRATKNGDKNVRLIDGRTVALRSSQWFEPASVPDPDWSGDPVDVNAIFLFEALKGITDNPGYTDRNGNWRIDTPSGAFVMVQDAGNRCVAALFHPSGKRVRGMACVHQDFHAYHGLSWVLRGEMNRREDPESVAEPGIEFSLRGRTYRVTGIDAEHVHTQDAESGAPSHSFDLRVFEDMVGLHPIPAGGERAAQEISRSVSAGAIQSRHYPYQGNILDGLAFAHQCLADGYEPQEQGGEFFFVCPGSGERLGPLEREMYLYARHVQPEFQSADDAAPVSGLLAWPQVDNQPAVRRALRSGVSVPPDVLMRYPELLVEFGI